MKRIIKDAGWILMALLEIESPISSRLSWGGVTEPRKNVF